MLLLQYEFVMYVRVDKFCNCYKVVGISYSLIVSCLLDSTNIELPSVTYKDKHLRKITFYRFLKTNVQHWKSPPCSTEFPPNPKHTRRRKLIAEEVEGTRPGGLDYAIVRVATSPRILFSPTTISLPQWRTKDTKRPGSSTISARSSSLIYRRDVCSLNGKTKISTGWPSNDTPTRYHDLIHEQIPDVESIWFAVFLLAVRSIERCETNTRLLGCSHSWILYRDLAVPKPFSHVRKFSLRCFLTRNLWQLFRRDFVWRWIVDFCAKFTIQILSRSRNCTGVAQMHEKNSCTTWMLGSIGVYHLFGVAADFKREFHW